jgi:hypothetical protein
LAYGDHKDNATHLKGEREKEGINQVLMEQRTEWIQAIKGNDLGWAENVHTDLEAARHSGRDKYRKLHYPEEKWDDV